MATRSIPDLIRAGAKESKPTTGLLCWHDSVADKVSTCAAGAAFFGAYLDRTDEEAPGDGLRDYIESESPASTAISDWLDKKIGQGVAEAFKGADLIKENYACRLDEADATRFELLYELNDGSDLSRTEIADLIEKLAGEIETFDDTIEINEPILA